MPGLTFIHPLMLWGLLVGTIPIIIHLLNKRRYRPIRWAAMRFLKEAIRVNARRIQIEDLILLILRCLVLMLAALAFTLPILRSRLLLGQQPHVCAVILLDDSYSMNYVEGDTSRFASARDAARDLIGKLRRGDSVSVILMSDRPRRLFREPTFDLDLARNLIGRLNCSYAPASADKALELAREDVSRARQPARLVCIISDFQKGLLSGSAVRAHLTALEGEKADLVAVPIGEGYESNLAVVGLEPEAGVVAVGVPTTIHAQIRNYGQSAQMDYPVELHVNGRRTDRRWVDVPAGSEVDVTFLADFRETGQHAVEVRIPADSLPTDNARYHIIEVRDKVPILLVSGESAARRRIGATEYFGTALAPGWLLGELEEDHLSPMRVSPAHLRPGELEEFPTVVLIDVAALEDHQIAALQQYVQGGGGLLIVPGPRTSVQQFNNRLYRDGRGLLPARIVMPGFRDEKDGCFLSPESFDHPVLAMFSDAAYGDLSQTRFERTLLVDTPTTSRVVCKFSTGRPAIVERPYGKGRVMLIASGLGRDWGNFVWKPSFLILTRRMTEYLMRRGSEGLNLNVYDAASRLLRGELAAASYLVSNPDGTALPADTESAVGGVRVRYDSVDQPGIYRLTADQGLVGRFAANVDVLESDLGLPPMGLAGTPLRRVAPGKLEAVAGETVAGSELWVGCLKAAILLMIAEILFLLWIELRDKRTRADETA